MKLFRQNERRGFTLLELLTVIAIIGILAALLFPAISGAINKSRRTAALAEVRGIETALKKYYQEYTSWPEKLFIPPRIDEAKAIPIRGDMVRMLLGEDPEDKKVNPRLLSFIEFTRVDTAGDAISPWGSKDASRNKSCHYYYAKFDADFDNVVNAGRGGAPFSRGNILNPNPDTQPAESVRRNVIVWTYDPKARSEKDYVIGTWSR
jgi:prepilin-type N-terminal cleavage/methylation domain-containing protein